MTDTNDHTIITTDPEDTASSARQGDPVSVVPTLGLFVTQGDGAMTDTEKWLDLWLDLTTHNVELRFIPSKRSVFSRDKVILKKALSEANGQNVYFGVYGRDGLKGSKEFVKECNCLFVDIDFKDLEKGQETADVLISEFPHKPTMVVSTGGGYHCYWMLSDPVPASPELEDYLYGLALELKGDTQASELARVLRVPGTKNQKYTPARPVSIAVLDDTRRYSLDWFTVYKKRKQVSVPSSGGNTKPMFTEGRKDSDLFHTANCLTKGGMPPEEQVEVLTRLVNSWGENDSQWVSAKVRSAIERHARKERNTSDEVREWVESANGVFMSTDVAKCLQLSTRNDQKNLSTILKRLSQDEKPLIEKYGNKNGCYRRILNNERKMNLADITVEDFDIVLPLGLHKKTRIFRKSILTVAGVTGTGKTSFALNFIRDNMTNHRIYYINQEMHELSLKFKLEQFPMSHASDWTFTPLTDVDDYPASIRPDDVNVIDYLEAPNSEFYRIGELIRNIERRLRNGIALILLQRKGNNVWGEGGEFSARASSLYVNMDWGSIEVVKNRFREGDAFPNHHKRNFKIEHGVMKAQGGWLPSDKKQQVQQDNKYAGFDGTPDETPEGELDPDFEHEE